MACVAVFGVVEWVPLDPGCTAGSGVRDHAVEQCRGDPVPSERRSDDEARDPNYGCRLGSVGIDMPVKTVVGAKGGVDPPSGSAIDVREIPEGRAAPQSLGDGPACFAP